MTSSKTDVQEANRCGTSTRDTTERSTTIDTPIGAELYLRGDAHGGLGVEEVVERANRLEANGVFGESIVAGEWHRCHTRAEDWRSEAMETYEAFREWADANGFSLEPGFQQRTRSFIGMDDVEEVVVFPVVALAIYEVDELTAVLPCTDGDRTHTVESALAAFERGDEAWLTQFDPVTVDHAEPRLGSETAAAD
ncbi:MAG: HTH domain-containing protein [Haloarculaceae archaeon]